METTAEGPILFRNTMRITEGHLAPFREAIERAVRFVEEHGPQLMVDVFVDEQAGLAYSFQLYRDSDAVLTHWQLSDPYIQEVMAHCTVEAFEVYGQPDRRVLDGMGIDFTHVPRLVGFERFATSDA